MSIPEDGILIVDPTRLFSSVSPLKAVKAVLETSWLDQVAANIAHRKECAEVKHIDIQLSRTWMKYPLGEQALLLTQVTGVTFTRDCLSHAVGAEISRACGPFWLLLLVLSGSLSFAMGAVCPLGLQNLLLRVVQ